MTFKTHAHVHHVEHEVDVCVVGGGIAGLCAAVASARHGAQTLLIHDRPVLGGNAGSEVRMHICGAHGDHNQETGLVQEIQLENCYRNPSLNYSIWDSVLYEKAVFQPGLTTLLNTSVTEATMEAGRIAAVKAWTLTSQTWHTVRAKQFIDCSGDCILAPGSRAEIRAGRESRDEFGEDIEPMQADGRTMGNSLLIQIRYTDEPQPFVPPRWAYKFETPEDVLHRVNGVQCHNFWWIEIGGCRDTIADAEEIRDDLMRAVYGVWDYVKNRAPDREQAANWAIEWIGSLPGKRENRRYVGDHMMTAPDVRDGGDFDDIIAYGGWTMDDHHPAGILYPGKPTIFHPAPSPFGIPYRSIYSRNVPNLLMAGRNISVTHAALSATRVIGTCAVLGQAAGTAAARCVASGADPRDLSGGEAIQGLQRALMDDDAWLPGLSRPIDDLAGGACLRAEGKGAEHLLDGIDRDRPGESHHWSGTVGETIEYTWDEPVRVGGARLVLDSDLSSRKAMPHSYPQKGDRCLVPSSLLRAFSLETRDSAGNWHGVAGLEDNYQRLVRIEFSREMTGLRLVPEATWGEQEVRIFAFEPTAGPCPSRRPEVADGPTISQLRQRRSRENPRDMAPPDSGLE